ncbi:MAG: hypothetical protein JXJ04_17615 [Spirochaetales bacterium]|nr:hypothetical protein [Spirochaetales bacterium]
MIEKAKADFKKAVELNNDNLLLINELKKRFPEFDLEF